MSRVINPYPEYGSLDPNLKFEALSDSTLFDIYQRILPQNYLSTLLEPGPGSEYLHAIVAVMERVSQSVANEANGQYIQLSPAGSVATGTVTFYRTGTLAGAYYIAAGTVVSTPEGYCFRTTQEVHMGATDLSIPNVTVESSDRNGNSLRGYLWNIQGPYTRPDTGEVIDQGISVIVKPLLAPTIPVATYTFDPYLRVKQTTDTATVGGTDPMLAALGLDRGITAPTPFTDPVVIEAYRASVERLPDTVSIQAILRATQAFMSSNALTNGKPWDVIEQWESAYQTCYDAPITPKDVKDGLPDPNFTVNQLPQTFTSNVFVYDDPRGLYFNDPAAVGLPYHIANRYLSPFPTILLSLPDLGNQQDNTTTYSSLGGLLAAVKPAGVQLQFILEGE